MAKRWHVYRLTRSIARWNAWREARPDVWPDLRNASLDAAHLAGANLVGASLVDASLDRANLDDARLEGARLDRARLVSTRLDGASFYRASLDQTIFANVDLSKVMGLYQCEHLGPSIIDHCTLARSGPLPLVFLRGCGLSDYDIEVAKLYQTDLSDEQLATITDRIHELRGTNAIDYQSCFISYALTDESSAQALYAALQDAGVRCWCSPENLKIGDRLQPHIDGTLHSHRKLLLILSATSIDSTWIEQEAEAALAREREEESDVLFPIRLDEAVMDSASGWAAQIRDTRHIGDFTQWQNEESFQVAFQRLLRDLRGAHSI